jgi:hypothetical protein
MTSAIDLAAYSPDRFTGADKRRQFSAALDLPAAVAGRDAMLAEIASLEATHNELSTEPATPGSMILFEARGAALTLYRGFLYESEREVERLLAILDA